MIFTIKFKKRIADASNLEVIIGKLSYKKKSYSIILFKINKNPIISFYYAILSLDLTIYL